MRKLFRYWRITFSALCLITCAQLVSMWIREYRQERLLSSYPYAYPVLLTAALAALPWAKGGFRFSLRGLLIAMTLFALTIGLAMALIRWKEQQFFNPTTF
jgi:hypothetical protein